MFDIDFWRGATIGIAAIGQTSFVAMYLNFPWWRSYLGRALFVHAFTFALLVNVGLAGLVWNWPGEDGTFVALYGLVALGIWGQVIAFIRVHADRGSNL